MRISATASEEEEEEGEEELDLNLDLGDGALHELAPELQRPRAYFIGRRLGGREWPLVPPPKQPSALMRKSPSPYKPGAGGRNTHCD